MSVLIVSKILRPFVNSLTPDNKYSLDNMKILKQSIEIQLSKELKIFSQFVTHSWSLHLILNICKEKVELHSLCISEILDGERRTYVDV